MRVRPYPLPSALFLCHGLRRRHIVRAALCPPSEMMGILLHPRLRGISLCDPRQSPPAGSSCSIATAGRRLQADFCRQSIACIRPARKQRYALPRIRRQRSQQDISSGIHSPAVAVFVPLHQQCLPPPPPPELLGRVRHDLDPTAVDRTLRGQVCRSPQSRYEENPPGSCPSPSPPLPPTAAAAAPAPRRCLGFLRMLLLASKMLLHRMGSMPG